MKYFNINSTMKSIHRIIDGNTTMEHRTGTAGMELARLYYPLGSFTITPEQHQPITNKKPDLSIEKFTLDQTFIPHTYIEFKSLINSSMNGIVQQLYDTLSPTLDYYGDTIGNHSAFIVGIKGTKIAFFAFHHFSSLLDEYSIPNYNGIMPLTYLIPEELLLNINGPHSLLSPAYSGAVDFNTNSWTLTQMGVIGTQNISYPHIFDLLDARHQEDIHRIFSFMAKHDAN